MVYESDFYTTRRPYTRPSSYSVTSVPLRYVPSYGKLHPVSAFYPSRSLLSCQRRLISRVAPHSVVTIRVRPSVVIRELDRIEHKVRSNYSYSPSEDFLCSNTSKNWEDESRKIRAQTASLLQKVHSSVPRATSVVPYGTVVRYNEPYTHARYTHDSYINHLLMPERNVARDINSMSWYAEPAKRFTGRGHLACIRYSGAKGFPNRKALCQELSVKDDVTLLSFYARNRLAASGLSLDSVTAAKDFKEQPALVKCS